MGYREDCTCSRCDEARAEAVLDVPIHILAAEILRQANKEGGH